ncbi:MAG: hypothetical protein A2Y98_02780 [Candidatus Portnoybacteria bacterium RBG_19FT_COMBO_36_7]|uniref:Leucyl aminopeptidase n=1 Tax=Candidatus Portnoybacteria bacterium RBG_19FT_COMBO_36_7 TaxID=1801992 RepID=A0A1G2F9E4_9BACT|nr:MAG: hypothetical protein A2Y98_02780 [Candidatus Portnoybacteria bacterium RBG_19FT_COMBO_36_7]
MYNPEDFPPGEIQSEKTEQEIVEIREKNACKMIEDFLLLKPKEKVLFLTDANPQNTDRELIETIKKQLSSKDVEFFELLADDRTTQEDILSNAKKCDLIWNSWSMEDTAEDVDFDKLTEFLEKTRKRMAWCPGVKAESLNEGGALTEEKTMMEFRLNKMAERLKDAVGFRITTEYGTDLKIKLYKGKRRWVKDSGVIEKGKWDNLPGGEIFTTPDEEKVDGVLVLPALQDEVSLDQGVDKFVRLTIKGGKIRKIDGGISAEKLRKYLEENSKKESDPESVIQCSEISFGANSKARTVPSNPTGGWKEIGRPTTETEKRLGTMHIAFGSSKHGEEGVEGHTKSDVHLDFVLPRHSLTVEKFTTEKDYEKQKNGEKLMNHGSWNFI